MQSYRDRSSTCQYSCGLSISSATRSHSQIDLEVNNDATSLRMRRNNNGCRPRTASGRQTPSNEWRGISVGLDGASLGWDCGLERGTSPTGRTLVLPQSPLKIDLKAKLAAHYIENVRGALRGDGCVLHHGYAVALHCAGGRGENCGIGFVASPGSGASCTSSPTHRSSSHLVHLHASAKQPHLTGVFFCSATLDMHLPHAANGTVTLAGDFSKGDSAVPLPDTLAGTRWTSSASSNGGFA